MEVILQEAISFSIKKSYKTVHKKVLVTLASSNKYFVFVLNEFIKCRTIYSRTTLSWTDCSRTNGSRTKFRWSKCRNLSDKDFVSDVFWREKKYFLANSVLPDFSSYNIPKREKIPNDLKIYQMAIKYTKWSSNRPSGHKTDQHLSYLKTLKN
jgi:hypothetical protein